MFADSSIESDSYIDTELCYLCKHSTKDVLSHDIMLQAICAYIINRRCTNIICFAMKEKHRY